MRSQQVDQSQRHIAALGLNNRGLLVKAPQLTHRLHHPPAHLRQVRWLVVAAENREITKEMDLQKAEEYARQQRLRQQPLRQRLGRKGNRHVLPQ